MLHRYITDVLSSSVQHRPLYHHIFGCDVMFLRWWSRASQRRRRSVPKDADVVYVFSALATSKSTSYYRLYFAECMKVLQLYEVINGNSNYQRNVSKSPPSPCRNVRRMSVLTLSLGFAGVICMDHTRPHAWVVEESCRICPCDVSQHTHHNKLLARMQLHAVALNFKACSFFTSGTNMFGDKKFYVLLTQCVSTVL
jgi:hypothetical protein